MKKIKGFTLIELLAVIVILGLLMAIAIPSVTKYITQSRKKTITTTIGNYIGALTNQVNDMEYTFTAANTVYAVPIECIALERGGTNPFGEWHQASDSYWAYVLVQYDDSTSSYTYGFTFRDSAGYGLYPTTIEKLNESGKQIQTGLNLNRPTGDLITNITARANWTGFDVKDDTKLVVLEATSEGETGNGITTCTLCQKGDNYNEVEQEKMRLSNLIKKHNTIITAAPTLTTSISASGDASGLYLSNDTNSGNPTYYFRGNVTNNYVDFAGLTWRIIRINEDGTVRLIYSYGSTAFIYFNKLSYDDPMDMYYSRTSGSQIKYKVDNWYKTNIVNTGYDSYVSTGTFCEQAKVKYSTIYTGGKATMEYYRDYMPNFTCKKDENEKGILNSKVGMLSYDEVIYAGGYPSGTSFNYYLKIGKYFWTMSPAGFDSKYTSPEVWYIGNNGQLVVTHVNSGVTIRPVINLNANVTATGTGTSSDPYVIQTN